MAIIRFAAPVKNSCLTRCKLGENIRSHNAGLYFSRQHGSNGLKGNDFGK